MFFMVVINHINAEKDKTRTKENQQMLKDAEVMK